MTTLTGTRAAPKSAVAARIKSFLQSIGLLRIILPIKMATSAVANATKSALVFIEVAKLAPSAAPARNALLVLNGRCSRASINNSQSGAHKSSVRNSEDLTKKIGEAPVSSAAQMPERAEER